MLPNRAGVVDAYLSKWRSSVERVEEMEKNRNKWRGYFTAIWSGGIIIEIFVS